MPPKPHRALIGRVSGYADEASAFLRRRRLNRQPFARVYAKGGRAISCTTDTDEGSELYEAASRVIEAAG